MFFFIKQFLAQIYGHNVHVFTFLIFCSYTIPWKEVKLLIVKQLVIRAVCDLHLGSHID